MSGLYDIPYLHNKRNKYKYQKNYEKLTENNVQKYVNLNVNSICCQYSNKFTLYD